MWSNFLREYSQDLWLIVFMALWPYMYWFLGRISDLAAGGQIHRIPRWLRWIPESNPKVKKALERGNAPPKLILR
jgi:hypothetical protein